MSTTQEQIANAIREVWRSGGQSELPMDDISTLSGDLALSSLDIAQLVVQLEQTLGIDPFRSGTAPVQTFGELVAVYEKALAP
jgi:acyl carrier protein